MVNNLSKNLELGFGATVDLAVQIRGPSETLKRFSIAKKISIDLKEYTEAGTYHVPVEVALPEGCTLVNDPIVEVVLENKSGNGSKDKD